MKGTQALKWLCSDEAAYNFMIETSTESSEKSNVMSTRSTDMIASRERLSGSTPEKLRTVATGLLFDLPMVQLPEDSTRTINTQEIWQRSGSSYHLSASGALFQFPWLFLFLQIELDRQK